MKDRDNKFSVNQLPFASNFLSFIVSQQRSQRGKAKSDL